MADMAPPSLDPTSEAVSISAAILIGTIISIFFVVAFCFFIYLYAKCYWSNNSEDPSIVSWRRRVARLHRRNRQGLDATALQSLPVVVYDPKDFKEESECVVCLSEVSEGEKIRLLPKCNHRFHVNCIDMWFKSHSTCPLCRNPVISTQASNHSSDREQDDNDSYSSESDFSDDDHSSSSSDSTPRAREVLVLPANVLFWGSESQFSSFGQAANDFGSSSGVNRPRNQDIVIEIPPSYVYIEGCLASSPFEEAKTPVMTRLASLKRLWSLGKRVVSSSSQASSSHDVDQQV